MIRIGEYSLSPDTHCWRLGKVTTRVGADGEESEVLTAVVYPSNITHAMALIMERRIRDADPETLQDIIDEVRKFRSEMSERFTLKVEIG